MERLTKRDGGGNARMNCDDCDLDSSGRCGILQCRNQFIHRLAAYEDTGLTPEEVAKCSDYREYVRRRFPNLQHTDVLSKADAEGRLLVLPCKVGDTVYLRDLTPCKVVGINIGHYTRTVTIEFNDGDRIPNWQPRGFDEFGVSVFTTREAAEAKLKTLQNT